MATITGSEVLALSLRSQGVDTLFYLMGGPMLETEAACITLGIRAVDTRHEQAAALAAHAWTRVTRRPGVCIGCSGPGTTNLVTGVANAFADCAPVVAIGGSSPRVFLGMEAFQEIDQVAVMRPVTKWAERIYDARRIPEIVATAFRQATTGAASVKALATPVTRFVVPGPEQPMQTPGRRVTRAKACAASAAACSCRVSIARMPSWMHAASVSSIGPPMR